MCLWVLKQIIYAKRFKFTPASDDSPPDGSMRFIEGEMPTYESAPADFLWYEFGSNYDESDPVAIELSEKIIEFLCRGKQTLTYLQSHIPASKKYPPMLTELYPEKLQDVSIFQENAAELAYLVEGYDMNVLPYYHAARTGALCDFSFYLFPEGVQIKDAEDGMKRVKEHGFALKMNYINYGPTSLEMVINPAAENVAKLEEIVKRICKEQGVDVINPNF